MIIAVMMVGCGDENDQVVIVVMMAGCGDNGGHNR